MPAKDTPEPLFDAQINVKMSQELKARLRRIEAKHGTPVPEILRRLGAAAATFFDENGYLTFPVIITPETFSPPAGTEISKGKVVKSTKRT
ncbi:hypothetical protein OPIT5_11795 [Opitutaceae bacterium TAV5]|nr:hypothetical protein OPIT5_11795 [Opitutaceae bacterium TAV5]